MKKTILTTIGLVAGATLIHAQGLIEIAARPVGSVQINTNSFYAQGTAGSGSAGAIPTQAVAPGAYDFALLVATSTSAGDVSPLGADWSQAQIFGGGGAFITASNSVNLTGGISGTGGAGGVGVTGWAAGATEEVLLVGWSASLGGSWSTVEAELNSGDWSANGFFGYSGIASITSGGAGIPATPPESIFGAGIQGFDLYAVTVVPEPATLALAGLGGLSMLFLRRRKS